MACVLVVDDERGIRATLREFLKSSGHEVHLAADVAEARAILEAEPIDVIVLDVLLPRDSGIALLEHVHEQRPEIETIMMTGEPTIETTVQAMRLGAYDFLAKPVVGGRVCEVVGLAAARKAEREATALALRESEARFERIAENAPDVIWRADLEGRLVYVNSAVSSIFDRSPEQVQGRFVAELTEPDALAKVQAWVRALRGGEPLAEHFSCELRHTRGDGTLVPCEMRAVAVRDDRGEVVALEGITRDITKRKQAEEALRASERLSSMALNNTTDMIFVVEDEGAITFVNDAACRHFGIEDTDEVRQRGLDLSYFWCDSGVDVVSAALAEARASRSPRSLDCRCDDRFYNLVVVPVVEVDRVLSLVCVARDVTQRRLAEEQLRESEQRFRNVVESSPTGIITAELDDQGQVILTGANSAAAALIGVEVADRLGLEVAEALPRLVSADLARRLREATGGQTWEGEVQLAVGGSTLILIVHLFQTSPGKAAALLIDMTERRRARQERDRLEEQLRQSQRLEAIGLLAGGIAHDMNNLLGAIMAASSVLEREVDPGSPGVEDLETILTACRRGRELTHNLLRFSRHGALEKELFRVSEPAQATIELLARTVPKSIRLQTELADDLWPIEGDRTLIGQALMNLCLNAIEAMSFGGAVTLAARNLTIEREGRADWPEVTPGDYVLVEVVDTGEGMSSETRQRAFEPFFTRKAKKRGAGLGLSMVYGTARGHGGTVRLRSEIGIGSSASLLLPAQRSAAGLQERGGGEVVLLVDDEPLIRYSGRRLLEKLGYRVIEAVDGEAAVALYRERAEEISLVMLDMVMPRVDGGETLPRLLEQDPGARVLLVSGYSDREQVEALLAAGARGFIEKPFDIDQITRKLSEVLRSDEG